MTTTSKSPTPDKIATPRDRIYFRRRSSDELCSGIVAECKGSRIVLEEASCQIRPSPNEPWRYTSLLSVPANAAVYSKEQELIEAGTKNRRKRLAARDTK
jgi:hypothetical protein